MNKIMIVAFIATAISAVAIGSFIVFNSKPQSELKNVNTSLEEQSNQISSFQGEVNSTLVDLRKDQYTERSRLELLQRDIDDLDNRTASLEKRVQLVEDHLSTSNSHQANGVFPSDRKIIWYGQFYQSNRDYDALEHLNSEGAWLDYRKLPVNNIADAKVVVLSSVYAFHKFSQNEIDQLHQFVNSGGTLVIAVDTDYAFCENSSDCGIDPIAQGFGFAFGDDISDFVLPTPNQSNHPIWNAPYLISSVQSLSDAIITQILDQEHVKILGVTQQSGQAAVVINENPSFRGGRVLGIGLTTFLGNGGDFRMLDNVIRFVTSDELPLQEGPRLLVEIANRYGDLESLKEIGVLQAISFFKVGGNQEDGQLQPSLGMEIPVGLGSGTANMTEFSSLKIRYFADVSYDSTPKTFDCSDLRIHLFVDDMPLAVSSWLGYENRIPELPLDTGLINLHSISTGQHTIKILPEGRLSGCNTDYLRSWGGTFVIFDSTEKVR